METLQPAISIESFLEVSDPTFDWVATALRDELIVNPTVPALSETTMKLSATVENEDASMDDIEKIISLDPGLTTRCLQMVRTGTWVTNAPIT